MRALQKKLISVLLICALLILGAVAVSRMGQESFAGDGASAGVQQTMGDEKAAEAYQKAKTDLVFWYEDASYDDFFQTAAIRYFAETGSKVAVQCCETLDYMGDIYDKTMQDDAFPDVYLISGDNLEAAYRYGLAAVNDGEPDKDKLMAPAREAAMYQGKLFGYPLSFNTCVFIYQTDYFASAPESLQSFIDYSNENEPAENVEYLLEWDVNDAFYDFPFISNSITFDKSEPGVLNVIRDEELYQKDLEYFDKILISFSVDAEKVSEDHIIENFKAGRTLSAIIDTDSLHRLEGYSYSLMQMPDLNEELPATSCAITNMLVVNDFSEKKAAAADFAQFVTTAMSDELYEMTGHFSVMQSEEPEWVEQVANEAYLSAVPVPDSQDARDFWVELEETISKYF